MAEIDPIPLPRISRYESLGYGLFLHWGLYSLLGMGEWAKHYRQIPWEQYAPLRERFTAADWNPHELVKFARGVGFRYICLTTRHHDGFSLYDTRGLNDWDAPNSGARRDLVAEFAEACHADGMPMFLYHTTLDWWNPAFEHDWEAYLGYLNASVEILATQYGPVSGFWFDGNWSQPDRDWKEDALYAICRKHQPDAIIVNNSGTHARGKVGHPEVDVVTFEQGRPVKIDRAGQSKYLAAEMCETLNSHWGHATRDFSYKRPGAIITTLTSCRRHGANLLLNVGPTASGALPAYDAALLQIVGRWIEICAPHLHTSRPTGLTTIGHDFVLHDGKDYYYFLHGLPVTGSPMANAGEGGGGLKTVGGLNEEIRGVQWTDNNEPLAFSQDMEKHVLTFHATNHPYGEQFVVRVAKIAT